MNRILRISAAMAVLALLTSPLLTAEDPALKEAWDRLPKAERWFQQGVKEFGAGRPGDAAKDFEKCLQEIPRHAFARYYLANIAYIANDLPRALGDMNTAIEDLGFMESLNEYGLAQKAKTYDSYKRMMNEGLASAPNCRARAEIDSLSGELTDAKSKQELLLADQKAARSRQKAHYLYFLGNIHFQLKRFLEAARNYEEAIALNPRHASAYNNLAAIYYLAGDHAAAFDYLERAMRQGLEDNLNLTLQSLVFEALGRPTEGILREEIAAGPQNDLAIVRFALAFISKDPLRPTTYENVYVLFSRSTSEAVVIDPGAEDLRLDEFVRDRSLKVKAILNTHWHGDHTDANAYYSRLFQAPVLIGAEDAKALAPAPAAALSDGQVMSYEGFSVTVLRTPGHTPGSVCFLAGEVLISGDTLFKGAIGSVAAGTSEKTRTLQAEIVRGIRDRLLVLPDATRVCPGHGKTTTIGDERANNAFLKQ
jgi:glyoxylase-like metal-dependent hydrolase (beta-lactamase superfamily II)/outer membrane protein assembly factor BamD (BamD/ComL family)